MTTNQRSAVGAQQQGNVTYSVMPEQIRKQLATDTTGEFIVIRRARQGDEPQVWSTGDRDLTEQVFRQVYTNLAFDRQPA